MPRTKATAWSSRPKTRQHLPVRVKHAESHDGHAEVDVEISLAKDGPSPRVEEDKNEVERRSKHPAAKVDPATPGPRQSRSIAIEVEGIEDEDGQEVFVTPLEAPARNPIEDAVYRAGDDAPTALEHGEEGQPGDDDSDDDSDDDAPPEAISTAQAARQTRDLAKAVFKVAEEQDAAQRRRRKEHQDRLNQQAQTRRKTVEQIEPRREPAAPEAAMPTPISAEAEQEANPIPTSATVPNPRKRRFDLLPDDLLATLSDSDSDAGSEGGVRLSTNASTPPKALSKKRRLERAEAEERRQLRDQRAGSTIFRVAAPKGDLGLAPKMSKTSRNLKMGMLVRNRVAQRRGGFWRANRMAR